MVSEDNIGIDTNKTDEEGSVDKIGEIISSFPIT
jgi:hypothetical protein